MITVNSRMSLWQTSIRIVRVVIDIVEVMYSISKLAILGIVISKVIDAVSCSD